MTDQGFAGLPEQYQASNLPALRERMEHWMRRFEISEQRRDALEAEVKRLETVASDARTAEREVCLCAAIQMADGYVFRGHRHDDCYLTMGGWTKYTKADGHAAVQGFLTSRGRFVTRKEAAELHGYSGVLTSEDLW